MATQIKNTTFGDTVVTKDQVGIWNFGDNSSIIVGYSGTDTSGKYRTSVGTAGFGVSYGSGNGYWYERSYLTDTSLGVGSGTAYSMTFSYGTLQVTANGNQTYLGGGCLSFYDQNVNNTASYGVDGLSFHTYDSMGYGWLVTTNLQSGCGLVFSGGLDGKYYMDFGGSSGVVYASDSSLSYDVYSGSGSAYMTVSGIGFGFSGRDSRGSNMYYSVLLDACGLYMSRSGNSYGRINPDLSMCGAYYVLDNSGLRFTLPVSNNNTIYPYFTVCGSGMMFDTCGGWVNTRTVDTTNIDIRPIYNSLCGYYDPCGIYLNNRDDLYGNDHIQILDESGYFKGGLAAAAGSGSSIGTACIVSYPTSSGDSTGSLVVTTIPNPNDSSGFLRVLTVV